MAYIALYRKYRSQSFGEVVGQNHVTAVLQNAIKGGRIAHAYLFGGPRGCGKTSTARLLARALNCECGEGPTHEPCGECSLCVRIRAGSAMDVIEMDAASETGIDDVREKIIENARFMPAEARYKVYIIDEVHDLSAKAFDSLLKTLEEPPAHVVFILATTESHKVPITVRSRCQRLDFRRGTMEDLAANLRRVLELEGIEYEPEAVVAVARAAEGSFRDSLSLLEQSLAYSDGKLTADAVNESIGAISSDVLDEVTRILAADDLAAMFFKAGELVDSGRDVKQILIALQSHLRDLIAASVTRSSLPDISPARFDQLKEQAKAFTTDQLLKMLDVLAEAERDIRWTNQHRLLLERAFWSILPSSLTASAAVQPTAIAAKPAPQREAARPAAVEPAPVISGSAIVESNDDEADSTPVVRPVGGSIDLDGMRRMWPRVRKRVVQAFPSTAAWLGDATVKSLEGRTLILGFTSDLLRAQVDRPKGRKAVEDALAEELGVTGFTVRCELGNAPPRDDPATPVNLSLPSHESGNGSGPIQPEPGGILDVVMKEFGDRLVDEPSD